MKNLIIIHKNLRNLYTGGQHRLAALAQFAADNLDNVVLIDRGQIPEPYRSNRLLSIWYLIKIVLHNRKNVLFFVNHGSHFRYIIPFFFSRLMGNTYGVNCNQTFYNFRKPFILRVLEFICEYLFLHAASLLIFPSRASLDYFRPFHLYNKDHVIVNPAPSIHGRRCIKVSQKTFQLLTVGQVQPWKGLDIIIKALALLKHKYDIHLHVIGRKFPSSSFYQRILRDISTYDLNEIITLHGHKGSHELMKYYESSDIFILSSRYETYGIVLLEAMSFGLPIVSAKIPSASEILEEGKNALFYDVENHKNLAACIARLLDDAVTRKKMRENNYKRNVKKRTWKIVAEETLQAIERHL